MSKRKTPSLESYFDKFVCGTVETAASLINTTVAMATIGEHMVEARGQLGVEESAMHFFVGREKLCEDIIEEIDEREIGDVSSASLAGIEPDIDIEGGHVELECRAETAALFSFLRCMRRTDSMDELLQELVCHFEASGTEPPTDEFKKCIQAIAAEIHKSSVSIFARTTWTEHLANRKQ